MEYGFCPMGFFFLTAIVGPSFYWVNRQEFPDYQAHKQGVFQGLDRVGLTASGCIVLVYRNFSYQGRSPWLIFLALALILLLLYTVHWIYCLKKQCLPRKLGRLPLTVLSPGALLFLAIYGKAPWLIFTALIYGIGHVGGWQDRPDKDWHCCCGDSCSRD